jgi:NADPH-dependent glutamate synthase beta subunit-like oxidoreductase
MLHFGIPAYRLPREELMKEVRAILAMGVTLVLEHKVDDVLAEKEAGGFDCVFLAIGAQMGKRIEIPTQDASRLVHAISLLRDTASGEPPKLGRRVVVYGAGNTAMDAARTARRLGVEAVIVYRSDRAHMRAQAFEADEAMEEGVKFKWLTTIKGMEGSDLTLEQMELDANGRPRPTGRLETLSADAVVLALGQETDSEFLRKVPGVEFQSDGVVSVAPNMMTGHPGIFAGGDMVPTERTVTAAVGHGKKAARHIDAWLRGSDYRAPPKHPLVPFEMLHLPVYSDAARSEQERLPVQERLTTFSEVQTGLSAEAASYEAKRCLSCGNCFECDQCYAACPEQAIAKLGPGRRYRYLYERCTGCAVCFEACPCHAIEMIAEPVRE